MMELRHISARSWTVYTSLSLHSLSQRVINTTHTHTHKHTHTNTSIKPIKQLLTVRQIQTPLGSPPDPSHTHTHTHTHIPTAIYTVCHFLFHGITFLICQALLLLPPPLFPSLSLLFSPLSLPFSLFSFSFSLSPPLSLSLSLSLISVESCV